MWAKLKNSRIASSSLVKNSAWGILSNVFQIFFVVLFFVIISQQFSAETFAKFLISSTVYQIIAAFSSMGLGQWFIRQYVLEENKISFTSKFLKTQAGLGFAFYLINIMVAYLLYSDSQIRLLCLILGTNILFDNLINAIRTLNIAEGLQKKTALILSVDGFFKLLCACILFIYPLSPYLLATLMIIARALTLGLFIQLGSGNTINLKALFYVKIYLNDIRNLILKNWQFMVIGSISIIYWRIGNIIISKTLTLIDVANYEIAFRFLSVFQILPVVAAATIYPKFIKMINEGDINGVKLFFKNIFLLYTLFAVLAYVFIYCFAETLVTVFFGSGYYGAIICLQQMFLTFLILPTVLLQANLIVSVGLEKIDMWLNIFSLIVNVAACIIGLYFITDLSMINYSVFLSFIIFHVLQDVILIKRKFMTVSHSVLFYLAVTVTILSVYYFTPLINPYLFFFTFFVLTIFCTALFFFFQQREVSLNLNKYLKFER